MAEIKYKVVNGTSYHQNAPDAVIRVLENAMRTNKRIRVFYGDTETGRDWMEIYDTIGTIGRSCGQNKIPLLIKNSRSYGGCAILTDCIVKITIDKEIVYTVNQDGSRTKDVTNMNIRAYDKFEEIVHDAGILIVTAVSSSIFLGGIAKLINACHKPKDNDW